MEIEIQKEDASTTVSCRGRLTIYTVRKVRDTLEAIVREGRPITLDMGQVVDIDTAGIQLLMALKRHYGIQGIDLSIRNHSPILISVLDLYGLAGYFGDRIVLGPNMRKDFSFAYGTKRVIHN